jgi:hypothetical protein
MLEAKIVARPKMHKDICRRATDKRKNLPNSFAKTISPALLAPFAIEKQENFELKKWRLPLRKKRKV